MTETTLIIGAGIVGISCALALQSHGHRVVLVDGAPPAHAASRWNAGVLTRTSLLPLNNPALWSVLPKALMGRMPGFRADFRACLAHMPFLARFLAASRGRTFQETVQALDALIQLSGTHHRTWLKGLGKESLLQEKGWLFAYQTQESYEKMQWHRDIYAAYDIAVDALSGAELGELEPALQCEFARASWIRDAAAFIDPHQVAQAYFASFLAHGGIFQQTEIRQIVRQNDEWLCHGPDQTCLRAKRLILATGAGTNTLLATFGKRLPMMVERGYVQTFAQEEGEGLTRPLYDVAAGLVLSPRPTGVQVSTGVHLTKPDRPHDWRQLKAAEIRAKSLLVLGKACHPQGQVGNRPTLPDSRPAIGPCHDMPDIWLACGHQHIGVSTAAGTAHLIRQMIEGTPTDIPMAPFAPARFGL